MARITVEDCLEKIDNQYDLVLLAKERTVQLDAGAAGSLRVLNQELARKSGKDVKRFMEQEDNFGQLEFDALVRKIDKLDDPYRL